MTDALRRAVAAMPAPGPWLVLLLAFVAQLPLVLNPGYYSHDELQWAARAVHGEWFSWAALDAFQYRPLTFNLWVALSKLLFAKPQAFHAVLVLWGCANAALLCAIGRRFGMRPWATAIGALCFALSPYATYVHGWVGCIGDLAWLSCALLAGWIALRVRRLVVVALAAAVFTATGLLAKEAALAIPALAAVAWWFDAARRPRWLAVMLGSGAVAVLFLALRADALLHAPREGAQYVLSLANVPLRWLEYQLFPVLVTRLETFTMFSAGVRAPVVLAALLWIGLVWALWRAGIRYLALFLLGGVAALAPVLPLGSAWNHYAYGFVAVASMVVAAAWKDASRRARLAIAAFAGLALLHGAVVMLGIYQVGRVQSVFSPALAQVVSRHGDAPLRLQLASGAKPWIFARLTHEIPEYDDVAIGGRARLVGAGEAADFVVLPDGRLQPLPP
jgi:hypothetical protein